MKLMAIEYKGGKCLLCGYDKYRGALELHHVDPKTKSFALGHKGYTRSWQKVKEEIDKCVLLCANCHREVAAGISQLPAERRVEKRGELLEVLLARSRKRIISSQVPPKAGKVQRLSARSTPVKRGKRLAPKA